MSYSLINILKGGYIGDYIGTIIGLNKGDTRSLDYGSSNSLAVAQSCPWSPMQYHAEGFGRGMLILLAVSRALGKYYIRIIFP